MHFKCILLPNAPIATGAVPVPQAGQQLPELRLWGLTLGMTLDLLSSMSLPTDAAATKASTKSGDLSTYPHAIAALPQEKGALFAPSMASIFPRFVRRSPRSAVGLLGRADSPLSHSPTPTSTPSSGSSASATGARSSSRLPSLLASTGQACRSEATTLPYAVPSSSQSS